ncbi:uncharacterized protein LOC144545788 isoform X2 [Carex rostrata]
MLAFVVEVLVSLSAGDIATASLTWSSSWFMNDMVAYISRHIVETTPVMRKSPPKLRKFRLFDSTVMLPLFSQFESPIHFFSICSMSSPPVMLRIALEMSATSGEPLVKACPSIGDREAERIVSNFSRVTFIVVVRCFHLDKQLHCQLELDVNGETTQTICL